MRTVKMDRYVEGNMPKIVAVKTAHESVTNHDHDFYELVYISEGYCLHEMSGTMTLLMAGDLFIIPPGKQHRYMCNRDISLFNCMFTSEALSFFESSLLKLPGAVAMFDPNYDGFLHAHLELSERSSIVNLLEDMVKEYATRESGWDTLLRADVVALITHCYRTFIHHISDAQDKKAYMGYVNKALKYIDAHYTEELTIAEIAEHIGVSNDYFSRQFKQVTGIAPVEYLRRYRFARAMEMLAHGESITDTAHSVGFKNLCHFSREFKNQLGLTPSQYRRQYAEELLHKED